MHSTRLELELLQILVSGATAYSTPWEKFSTVQDIDNPFHTSNQPSRPRQCLTAASNVKHLFI